MFFVLTSLWLSNSCREKQRSPIYPGRIELNEATAKSQNVTAVKKEKGTPFFGLPVLLHLFETNV
jgi:hypothetical protein